MISTTVLLRPSVQSQVTGGHELSTWGVLSRAGHRIPYDRTVRVRNTVGVTVPSA